MGQDRGTGCGAGFSKSAIAGPETRLKHEREARKANHPMVSWIATREWWVQAKSERATVRKSCDGAVPECSGEAEIRDAREPPATKERETLAATVMSDPLFGAGP